MRALRVFTGIHRCSPYKFGGNWCSPCKPCASLCSIQEYRNSDRREERDAAHRNRLGRQESKGFKFCRCSKSIQIYPIWNSLQSPLICQKNLQNIQCGVSEERSRGKRSRDRRSRDRRSRDRRRSRDKRSRDRDRRRSRHVSQSALCGQSRPRNDIYLNILRNQIGWLFGLNIYYPGFA